MRSWQLVKCSVVRRNTLSYLFFSCTHNDTQYSNTPSPTMADWTRHMPDAQKTKTIRSLLDGLFCRRVEFSWMR